MKKQKISIFGQSHDADWLSPDNVTKLLEIAFDRAAQASIPNIESILNILDAVSKSWADPDYHLRKKAAKILPRLTSFSPQMIEEGFGVVSAICCKANLEKRLQGELGSLKILDSEEDKPHLCYRLKAVPNGVLLHLTAGNVFVGAIDSMVSGIITKNANILKMSRVDPIFPVLFIESIKEHDPEGIIWPNQAALLWKGGDEQIENILFNARLTIVFWGGYEALKSVKRRLGSQVKLIDNGPRYSFVVIEGEKIKEDIPDRLIKGLALDLSRWDQQACSSPHVVYVIDKGTTRTHALMEALFDEMVSLSQELPLGQLSFDEKVEIRKVREIAKMHQARGEGRLMCPDDFSFSLVLENDPVFKISCLNRTLFFKTVKDSEQLMLHIAPLVSYLQTVGLYCTHEVYQKLGNKLLASGACRLTTIGGMSEGHNGAPHEGSFMLRKLVQWVDIEYSAEPKSRVEELLNKLHSSPYYAGVLKKAGGCSFDNFLNLPLLDRDTFYRNSPPESEAILTGPMTNSYIYASGGTTGNPKFILYSNDEYRYVTDLLADIFRSAGLSSSDRVANLFIAGNLWTSFNVTGRALENLGCLNLPIGGTSDMENILKYLEIFKVNAIVGLPSIIINLAEEIERRKLPIKIEKILYAGEHMRSQTCEYLSKAVGAISIRSAGYACVDTGPIGWQCKHLKGVVHHVCEDYCYAEIVDSKTGELVKENILGEIVATNLNRVLMPVVRYKTGDMGRWVEQGKCQCGFNGRSFELLGRCDDLLVIGGINLLPVDVAAGLAKLPVGQSFQIIAQTVRGKDQLLLRLEADKKVSDEKVALALKSGSYKIAESLDDGWMTLSVEWFGLGNLPRNKRTGKIKTIVDSRH